MVTSLSANLAGEVGRDTRAIVGLLEFGRLIGEALSQGIRGKPGLELSAAPAEFSRAAAPGNQLVRPRARPLPSTANPQEVDVDQLTEIAIDCLRALVSFLIVGGIALWALPSWVAASVGQLRKRPFASAGFGALVFVNGFLFTLLFAALFVAIGLGLRSLTLDALGWAFWGVTFSSLGLAFSVFIVSFVWLSKVTVAILVGQLIFERAYPRALDYRASALGLGLIIYLLLCPIPVLGWTVALIATSLGLGSLFLGAREQKRARSSGGSSAGRRGLRKKKS